MKEKYIDGIHKAAKGCAIAAKVIKIVMAVFLGILAVAMVVLLALPRDLFSLTVNTGIDMEINVGAFASGMSDEEKELFIEEFKDGLYGELEGVDMDDVDVEFVGDVAYVRAKGVKNVFDMSFLIITLLTGVLYLAVTVATMYFIEQLCKALRDCASPFCKIVVGKIRTLAFAIIPWAVLPTITETVSQSVTMSAPAISVNFDLLAVAAVFLTLGISKIFEYGIELEKNRARPVSLGATDTSSEPAPSSESNDEKTADSDSDSSEDHGKDN